MKKIKSVFLYAGLFSLVVFSHASAAGILVGEWGMGNFDSIVQESMNDIFESPGMELRADYTEENDATYDAAVFSGWTTSTDATGDRVTAQGPDIDVLLWFYNFNMEYENKPFSFEFYAYLDGVLVDWTSIAYDGGTFGASTHGSPLNNAANYSFTVHDVHPAPVPAAAILLGSGLLGLAGFRKKAGRGASR